MNKAILEQLLGGPDALDEVARLAEGHRLETARPSLREIMRSEAGAITGSGYYGLTLEKQLIDTLGVSLESETAIKVLMVQDAHTPDFTAHDFRNDITNEVAGIGYVAGGQVITATEITLAAGLLTFDAADVSWPNSTIVDAMAAVGYVGRGGVAAADELLWLSDFVNAASTTNGTFTIQWNAAGIFTIDFTP